MAKKDLAVLFLKMAAAGEVRTAYEKFIAPDFIHHNQYFAGDRQSLLQAMEEAHQSSPNRSLEVKHAFEDGEYVVTHSLVMRKDPDALPIAVVHIFRFKNNQVVELWDLGQELIKTSPNQYGAF
jgi:predicted SnoaL-like aldol condensation-catalyzing enzyme